MILIQTNLRLLRCAICKGLISCLLPLPNRLFFTALLSFYFIALCFPTPLLATESEDAVSPTQSFFEWQQEFKKVALTSGITRETFEQAFDHLTLNEMVLTLDKSQPEFSRSIWTYVDNATANNRVKKGKLVLKKHRNLFDEVVKKYKIPAALIIAIWAMESDFGGNYGNMKVIRSLATLAYGGQRKQFSQDELLAALRILQKEKLQPDDMVGSWAGAMGHSQFMPSSFEKYAIDFNADGQRDLWHSLADAFASIANYMQAVGWKEGEHWGVEVVLPADFNWQQQAKFNLSNERLTVSEWMLWGIRPASGASFKEIDQLATLFSPAGHQGPVFLVFDNFDAIKKYNLSLSYSLAVGLLASGIASDHDNDSLLVGKWPRNDKSLSRADKIYLQTYLNKEGFDAGKVDGKVGINTRRAIRAWQLKHTLAADGYMSLQLFEKIKDSIRK